MTRWFQVGDKVRLSKFGRENESYSNFADDVLIVTHVATRYMPAKDFFDKGRPAGYHPGFDAATGEALYDLKRENGESIDYSLYDWELRHA
jgi:hypothetical protein